MLPVLSAGSRSSGTVTGAAGAVGLSAGSRGRGLSATIAADGTTRRRRALELDAPERRGSSSSATRRPAVPKGPPITVTCDAASARALLRRALDLPGLRRAHTTPARSPRRSTRRSAAPRYAPSASQPLVGRRGRARRRVHAEGKRRVFFLMPFALIWWFVFVRRAPQALPRPDRARRRWDARSDGLAALDSRICQVGPAPLRGQRALLDRGRGCSAQRPSSSSRKRSIAERIRCSAAARRPRRARRARLVLAAHAQAARRPRPRAARRRSRARSRRAAARRSRQAAVAGRARDRDVDGAVAVEEAVDRRGVGDVDRRRDRRAQPREPSASSRPAAAAAAGGFEQQPQRVDLADVAQRQRRDDVAAAWLCEHEPLRAQPRERRRPRPWRAEARRELLLDIAVPGGSSSRTTARRSCSCASARRVHSIGDVQWSRTEVGAAATRRAGVARGAAKGVASRTPARWRLASAKSY